MKLSHLFFIYCICTTAVKAQDVPYAQKAAELQKEIWGTTEAEFKVTKVPDNLKNESAVVLARSFSSQRSITGKFKFMVITAGIAQRNVRINTYHERVKINDKTALDKYSQLEYQKTLDNNTSLGIARFLDTRNTFVGAKIIKASGKEVVVNTGEEVLTKNESKDKQGKIAISGLEVGDIIDYYTCSILISEKGTESSFSDNDNLIILVDEYPVLYYNINFQFNKKITAKYIVANKAPALLESRNNDGELTLSVKLKNLPKYNSQLWTSPLRQYPYYEIGSAPAGSAYEGTKKYDKMTMLDRYKTYFQNTFVRYDAIERKAEDRTKDYFGSKKVLKATAKDSVMKIVYDAWKFDVFCNYDGDELDDVNSLNYRKANSKVAAIMMSMNLENMEIDHDILLVASKHRNTLENVFTDDDFETAIIINGAKPMYMFFDDIVTHFNEIPARFQGERAMVITPDRRNRSNYKFTDKADITLPVTPANENTQEVTLQVSLLPANMQKLKIDRQVKQTGYLRHDDQKLLIPVQDVDNGYMAIIKGETLEKRLSQVKKTKKMTDDYNFLFNKERQEMSKNFTTDIKNSFDQDPEQVSNFKIINAALEKSVPVFQHSVSFVLSNFVKKAGNNFIIDAGKLTGGFTKLEEKDKIRDKDIYMPTARTFKYVINIAIPQGYTVSGADDLNINKSNATGVFSSVAKVNGNSLTITVTRTYSNAFEKVADWPKLVEVMQTASDFGDRKILFEKKG